MGPEKTEFFQNDPRDWEKVQFFPATIVAWKKFGIGCDLVWSVPLHSNFFLGTDRRVRPNRNMNTLPRHSSGLRSRILTETADSRRTPHGAHDHAVTSKHRPRSKVSYLNLFSDESYNNNLMILSYILYIIYWGYSPNTQTDKLNTPAGGFLVHWLKIAGPD